MPKIVDREERRHEIVDALLRVTTREGHHGATSRAVAQELGVSTGSLWHYFGNFDEVVEQAAIEVTRRTLARIDQSTDGLRGLAALRALMREVLPVSEVARDEAHIVVGFWGRVATRELSQELDHGGDRWHDRILTALTEAVADGELNPATPIPVLARVLRSISYGQQVAEIIDETDADAHLAVLDGAVAPWFTTP